MELGTLIAQLSNLTFDLKFYLENNLFARNIYGEESIKKIFEFLQTRLLHIEEVAAEKEIVKYIQSLKSHAEEFSVCLRSQKIMKTHGPISKECCLYRIMIFSPDQEMSFTTMKRIIKKISYLIKESNETLIKENEQFIDTLRKSVGAIYFKCQVDEEDHHEVFIWIYIDRRWDAGKNLLTSTYAEESQNAY